jgi:hypothetical protein
MGCRGALFRERPRVRPLVPVWQGETDPQRVALELIDAAVNRSLRGNGRKLEVDRLGILPPAPLRVADRRHRGLAGIVDVLLQGDR